MMEYIMRENGRFWIFGDSVFGYWNRPGGEKIDGIEIRRCFDDEQPAEGHALRYRIFRCGCPFGEAWRRCFSDGQEIWAYEAADGQVELMGVLRSDPKQPGELVSYKADDGE